LSPDSFRDVELPALKRVMHGVAEILGHPVPCIIGGNTLDIIPYMLETGTNFLICPAEADRRAFLKAMEAHPQVKVRVNMPAEVTIHGPKARIAATVDEIVSLAAGRPNVLLGTGAIAYETPPEHILFLKEYCGA
jgi:uroporphyrinogen-III decarboxylase